MSTSDGLILIGNKGSPDPVYNRRLCLNGGYTRAKCVGTHSFFICYDHENYARGSRSIIVENTEVKDMGRSIRSLQGYDKKGLTLFPHPNYCGEAALITKSDPDILDRFPKLSECVSSLVVHKGTWGLYTEPDHRGTRISVDGKDSFGPGTSIPAKFSERVRSVKLIGQDLD